MRIIVRGLKVTGRKHEFIAENPLVKSSFASSFGGKNVMNSRIKCHCGLSLSLSLTPIWPV